MMFAGNVVMRSEFEKLSDIKDGFSSIEVCIENTGESYLYTKQEDVSIDTVRKAILWHIEDSELSEINNDYDQGWYDCLNMISKYVLEDK